MWFAWRQMLDFIIMFSAQDHIPGTIYGEVLRVRANCKVLRPYRLYKKHFQTWPSTCNGKGYC